MVFKNSFDNMTPEETALLEKYFCGYNYEASSHTFIANYIWKDTHHITWEIIGKYLCLLGMGTLETEEKEYFMSFPLTRWGSYDLEELRYTIDTARARFAEEGIPFEISMIPESLAPLLTELYGDEVVISHDRDDDDYIYLREDLAELKGRKYHQKKNHLNYFLRTYEWSYEEITPDNLEEVREFLVRINGDKLEELPEEWRTILQLESQAIQLLLEFVGTGQLFTGLIRVDGKVEAVSIGEYSCPISKEAVLVHVEKANPEIRGLYQAINKEFCRHLPEHVIYVNREEDMGMENLRQTKLSYKPVRLAEKYSAVWKQGI